ncbi:hypothetical protein PV779_58660 [Streptomyces sp. ID01-9D]|nr:hypothetical protein [Streptomyces sp. ID01-9D]
MISLLGGEEHPESIRTATVAARAADAIPEGRGVKRGGMRDFRFQVMAGREEGARPTVRAPGLFSSSS